MHPPTSKPIGIAALIIGVAGLSCIMLAGELQIIGPALALPFITVAIGILGRPGQFARKLQTFQGQQARVEIWGTAPPGLTADVFKIDSVTCLGVGIWIYLCSASDGRKTKLKIAQPTTMSLNSAAAEIGFAGYAQWDGKRIKDPRGRRAPGTVVLTLT